MKVLLINPPRYNDMCVGREDRCENTIPNVITPHGLVYLAGYLHDNGHQVQLIDANGFNYDFEYINNRIISWLPDMVVFKSTPETFYSDIKVNEITKNYILKPIKTVMICYSLSTVPEQVMQNVPNLDVYITDYDYEPQILNLANDVSHDLINGIAYRDNHKIVINPPLKRRFDFSKIHKPAWWLIPSFDPYWIQVPSINPCVFVETSKGCGKGCKFCTLADQKITKRNINDVIEEIEYLQSRGVKYINFFDSTFDILHTCYPLYENKIKLKWFANIRADINYSDASLLASTGCQGVSIGVESGSQKILNLNNKGISIDSAERTIEYLKQNNIKQYVSFIVGLPSETQDTITETIEFIKRNKPTGFQVNSFVPYPRCQIYKESVDNGKITEFNFNDLLLYDTPISVCDLSPDEINEARKRIYKEIYGYVPWWINNIKSIALHPSDWRLGFDYGMKVMNRIVKGVNKEI